MTAPPDIKLSRLTQTVLERLRSVQIADKDALVGDAEIPQYANTGWGQGGPNVPGNTFTPYGILIRGTAMPGAGSLADPRGDWKVPYTLQTYGASREQVELVADWFREPLDAMLHEIIELDNGNYRVQQTEWMALGGIERVPGTTPSYFGEQDQFTLWLAKRRS